MSSSNLYHTEVSSQGDSQFPFSFTADKEDQGSSSHEFEALGNLRTVWTNEKRSPELLRFETSAFEEVQSWLKRQQQMVPSISPDMREIYALDCARVEYIMKSYLRFRLFKIQKFAAFYLKKEPSKLSPAEHRFATKFLASVHDHFVQAFLHCLPDDDAFQSTVNEKDYRGSMIREPEMFAFVFARAIEHVGKIACGTAADPYEVTIEKDKTYLVKYADIKGLLEQGRLCLV